MPDNISRISASSYPWAQQADVDNSGFIGDEPQPQALAAWKAAEALQCSVRYRDGLQDMACSHLWKTKTGNTPPAAELSVGQAARFFAGWLSFPQTELFFNQALQHEPAHKAEFSRPFFDELERLGKPAAQLFADGISKNLAQGRALMNLRGASDAMAVGFFRGQVRAAHEWVDALSDSQRRAVHAALCAIPDPDAAALVFGNACAGIA